jgi:hypothetical protein
VPSLFFARRYQFSPVRKEARRLPAVRPSIEGRALIELQRRIHKYATGSGLTGVTTPKRRSMESVRIVLPRNASRVHVELLQWPYNSDQVDT